MITKGGIAGTGSIFGMAIVVTAMGAALTVIGVAQAADPATKCQAGKSDVAGKYFACMSKAEKGFVAGGDQQKYDDAVAKCLAKYTDKWGSLEETAGAGVCPSDNDVNAIQAFLDACQAEVASAVAGSPLLLDVATCNSSLVTCSGGLATCNSNLGTCGGDLASTNVDLQDCIAEPECGNGVAEAGEECDDGNVAPGDSCIACRNSACGDGVTKLVAPSAEGCDDGNADNHDNCLNSCVSSVCGDGVIDIAAPGIEVCDDGNAVSGDGCSSDCRVVEHAFTCSGEPSACDETCGDGLVGGTETCDTASHGDFTYNGTNACSSSCSVGFGFACAGEPSACGYDRSFVIAPGDLRVGYLPMLPGGVPPISGGYPLIRTGTATSTNDACSAIAQDLTGSVALIRRGGCLFSDKANNAKNAGAVAVVIYNNIAEVGRNFTFSPVFVLIPGVSISKADGEALDALLAAGTKNIVWTADDHIVPCGNGWAGAGEQCDGSDLGGNECPSDFVGGSVSCTASCTVEYSTCTRCDLLDQDCTGEGQGCFFTGTGDRVCVTAGTVPDGGACSSSGECLEGSTCAWGECMKMCRRGGGAPECDGGAFCNTLDAFGYPPEVGGCY